MFSEADRSLLDAGLNSEKYNAAYPNFILLSQVSEQHKTEIIKTGFRLNQERKIFLKKYYEGIGKDNLFHLKGYQIKHESIGRTKLYQQLKEE
jgi:hypothetical protein